MKPLVLTAEKAFSLVEVVMALGVISFALVGMVGLLSVGFTAAKKSTQSTGTTAISSQVISAIRNDKNVDATRLTQLATTSSNLYFDYSGRMQTGSNATTHYQCEVRAQSVSAAIVPNLSGYTVLVLTVSSPVRSTNRIKEVVHATVPR